MAFSIHQPHDKLFKLSMTDLGIAKEFFAANLPLHILEKIDMNSLKLENKTFIDEAYKTTEADVVYSATLGNITSYLYLLCEQQTTVDLSLAFRLLIYTVRIMEAHRKQYPKEALPLVYPMVIYTGDEPWNAPLDIFPLFGEAEQLARDILLQPYQLIDVQRTQDDALRQHALSGLVAFVLKYRKTADFELFVKKLMPWIREVELQKTSGDFLCRIVVKYIVDRSPKGDKDLLVQEAKHYLSQELQGELMTIAQQWEQEGFKKGMAIAEQWKEEAFKEGMTIAEQWKEEGFKKGIAIAEQWKEEALKEGMTIAEQWKEEGMQQGEITLLKRLLQHRFGDLPFIYVQRLSSADKETLFHWGERVLNPEIKTLEEFFNEIPLET